MMKMKKKCNFHKKLFPFKGFYCKKSFQNPLVLCSKPFGKLKKFPFKGLFPFDGFPFNDFVLYYYFHISSCSSEMRGKKFFVEIQKFLLVRKNFIPELSKS